MRVTMDSKNVSNYSGSQTGHWRYRTGQHLGVLVVKMCPIAILLNWTRELLINTMFTVMCPDVQLLILKNQKIKYYIYRIEEELITYTYVFLTYNTEKLLDTLDTSRKLLKIKENMCPKSNWTQNGVFGHIFVSLCNIKYLTQFI